MSRHASIYLIISMCLFLGVRTLDAQEQPNMVVCENTSVSLGQTKQQVRNALAVCCRLNNNRIDLPDGTREQPNQIVFEANRAGACSGSLVFDTAEKLVYVQRDLEQFDGGSSALSLAHTLTEGISSLLPNPVVKPDIGTNTVKSELVNVELHIAAGPLGSLNTLFFTVAGRTLRFEVNDVTQLKLAVVAEEIGELRKGDLKSVPIRK